MRYILACCITLACMWSASAQDYRCNLGSEIRTRLNLPLRTIDQMRKERRYLLLIFTETDCFGLYKDGKLVNIGNGQHLYGYASTGRAGHETPLSDSRRGPDRVWHANKHHRSRKYDNARMDNAMFFMRDRDPDVALHSGDVSRENASHGCVRLPDLAAEMLFPVRDRLDIVVTPNPMVFHLLWETGYYFEQAQMASR